MITEKHQNIVQMVNAFFSMLIWNIPVTTFGAAAFGAGLSRFFGEPVSKQRNFWGQMAAACFFGTAIAALVAGAFDLKWAKENMSLFALINAACIRWFLQTIIDRAKLIIKEYKLSLNFGKSKRDDP